MSEDGPNPTPASAQSSREEPARRLVGAEKLLDEMRYPQLYDHSQRLGRVRDWDGRSEFAGLGLVFLGAGIGGVFAGQSLIGIVFCFALGAAYLSQAFSSDARRQSRFPVSKRISTKPCPSTRPPIRRSKTLENTTTVSSPTRLRIARRSSRNSSIWANMLDKGTCICFTLMHGSKAAQFPSSRSVERVAADLHAVHGAVPDATTPASTTSRSGSTRTALSAPSAARRPSSTGSKVEPPTAASTAGIRSIRPQARSSTSPRPTCKCGSGRSS